jgi:hypothetical protein
MCAQIVLPYSHAVPHTPLRLLAGGIPRKCMRCFANNLPCDLYDGVNRLERCTGCNEAGASTPCVRCMEGTAGTAQVGAMFWEKTRV